MTDFTMDGSIGMSNIWQDSPLVVEGNILIQRQHCLGTGETKIVNRWVLMPVNENGHVDRFDTYGRLKL